MGKNASFTMFLELKGKRWLPLELGQVYLLGKQINGIREKSNFIEIEEDEDVNQRHCVIETRHSEEAYVFDLFSLKGTLLNNKPISPMVRTLLKPGDIFKLGNQEVKYLHDVPEVVCHSHDSSGFLEGNKNNSDIIVSSPDSTFEHESRIKQKINNNHFLVPPAHSKKSVTPNKNLDLSATANTSKNSLNDSFSSAINRRSDSFTIPETQYCRPQNSSNASDLSITESIPENNASKLKLNFGNLDNFEDDDEFCIPETQEVLKEEGIICSQRPRLLSQGQTEENVMSIAEEHLKTKDVNSNVESQFRICTQDYNEGFGEEAGDYLHSQIIPFITHNAVILNNSIKSLKEDSKDQSKIECEDKELLAVKWSSSKIDHENTELRVDCSTPDIFDFDLRNNKNASNVIDKQTINKNQLPNLVDEEDFLPTQVLPLPSATAVKNKSLNLQDKPCLEKENEEVLILSDKENRYPVTLEPVTESSSLQYIDVLAAKPNTSSFSRHNISNVSKTNPIPGAEKKSGSKSLLGPDDEDDLLTQAFLQPSNHPICSTSSSNNIQPVKCFNSTLLDDKVMAKNPSTFFADIEKTPLKETSSVAAAFKLPDKDFSALKKTSSGASATSESDLDLLMCTPQLIKENIFVGKTEDLRKNILAAKNKNLFGKDTDEEEEEDEDPNNLVKLINIPKDSLDFDKLLPHLNNNSKHDKISEEQKAANETQKVYKFNISFGKELDEKQSKTSHSNSSTLNRDERHAARDKEKNLAEHKKQRKAKNKNLTQNKGNKTAKSNDKEKDSAAAEELTKENNKCNYRKSEKHKDKNEQTKLTTTAEENQETYEQEKTSRLRKRNASTDKTKKAKESKSEQKAQEMPARRMTRSKSRVEEAPSTSKQATQYNNDDLDSIATQPFVRVTRIRSSSKHNELQDDIAPHCSTHKSEHHKIENESSVSYNGLVNDNMTKTTAANRKRKADETPPVIPDKLVRKHLKSTCTDSLATSTKTSASSSKISISMTMVDYELMGKLVKNSKGFWTVAKNPADSDVLVMDNAFRTFKFLLAMARGIPIVTSEYLKKLNETQSIRKVKINDYVFTDAEFEKKHKFSLPKSLQVAKKSKIFKDYEFVMTPNILPKPEEITAIIEASGGSVCKKTVPPPKENQKLYLVTVNKDQKDWHKYRRLNKNIIIVSTEAIMSAVMRQSCERMTSYSLA